MPFFVKNLYIPRSRAYYTLPFLNRNSCVQYQDKKKRQKKRSKSTSFFSFQDPKPKIHLYTKFGQSTTVFLEGCSNFEHLTACQIGRLSFFRSTGRPRGAVPPLKHPTSLFLPKYEGHSSSFSCRAMESNTEPKALHRQAVTCLRTYVLTIPPTTKRRTKCYDLQAY